HRGIAVNPPAIRTPRQNSWPALSLAVVGASRIEVVSISQSSCRVALPPGARRDFFALHEEGIGRERRSITHRHAVVNERADTERAAGADRGRAGLVRAVFLRVALNDAATIENTLIADGSEGRLGDVDAVVEHP